MERDTKIHAVPKTPQQQPAPDGWADAYRETLEQLWVASKDHDGTLSGYILQAPDVMALLAFAAEIRQGIAASLITATPVVHVPLVGATRDEQPTRP